MSKNGIKILLDYTFKVILYAIEVRKNLVFKDFLARQWRKAIFASF
jgi:hypothetical protein